MSLKALAADKPTASAHFDFREFACKCGGRYAACRRIRVRRALLDSLEQYRAKAGGHPVIVVSGYRCTAHNARVGGVSNSQHLFGAAADIPGAVLVDHLVDEQLFAGIGYKGKTRLVLHVDRRDVSPVNTTNGSLEHPSRWSY